MALRAIDVETSRPPRLRGRAAHPAAAARDDHRAAPRAAQRRRSPRRAVSAAGGSRSASSCSRRPSSPASACSRWSAEPDPVGAGRRGLQQHDEETEQLLAATLAAIDDKLGADPVVLEMTALLGVVDLFVVTVGSHATARSAPSPRRSSASPSCAAGAGRSASRGSPTRDGCCWTSATSSSTSSTRRPAAYYDLEHLWSAAPRRDRATAPRRARPSRPSRARSRAAAVAS